MCAELFEQNGAEHHVAVLAALAALDVNHHAPAIDVGDLEARQFRIPHAGGVKGHEDGAVERRARRIDELCYLFLAENRGQAMRLLSVGSVSDAPRSLQRLNVEEAQGTQMGRHRTGRQLLLGEEVSLVLANVSWT